MNYAGIKWIGLYRCSTNVQTETSIPDQRELCTKFAERNGMTNVDEIVLAGISGSKARKRPEIESLIQRKIERRDFDAILVHDYSRLTRRGVDEAISLENRLKGHGIRVISATEVLPDGDLAPMMRSFYYMQAQAAVKRNAQQTARGQMSAILQGRTPGPRSWGYGIDRLYVSHEGRKHHIIRQIGKGVQIRIHPDTGEVLSTYSFNGKGKNDEESGEMAHGYHRQPDEKVVLIKGDPKRVETVRMIFNLFFVDGWGHQRIAHLLNEQGVQPPQGDLWHKAAIQDIIKNPCYTGRLICNRQSRAMYYRRSKSGPLEVSTEEREALERTGDKTFRPKEEWTIVELPELQDYLDPKIREVAIPHQERMLDKYTFSEARTNKDKHVKSSFFLKNILTNESDGAPYIGHLVDKRKTKGKVFRYYKPRGYGTAKYTGTERGSLVPAEPIEAMVKDVLSRVFRESSSLTERVKTCVLAEQKSRHEAKTRLGELESQRKQLAKKIHLLAAFDDVDEEFEKKVGAMKERLASMDDRLRVLRMDSMQGDPDAIAAAVVSEMVTINDSLVEASPETMRRIMAVFVGSMTVTPKTRHFRVTLRLPSWALENERVLGAKVCLEDGLLSPTDLKANHTFASEKDKAATAPPEDTTLLLAQVEMWPIYEPNCGERHSPQQWRFNITKGVVTTTEPVAPDAKFTGKLPIELAADYNAVDQQTSKEFIHPTNGARLWASASAEKSLAVSIKPPDDDGWAPSAPWVYWTPTAA